uniref:Uncharacterized protein n=1 Tax=viral metagenome TaxID=1070528 RepID=A0A6M3J490_9ZZZZ
MCFKKKSPVSTYLPPANYPSMTKQEVTDKMEEDIQIHEWWAGYVTQNPSYAQSYGDYDWHMAWIEVYKNTIYYLGQC